MDLKAEDIAWDTLAGRRLDLLARALPPTPRLELTVFGSALLSARITYSRKDVLPRISRISRIGNDQFPIRVIREIRGCISLVAVGRASPLRLFLFGRDDILRGL
jgi:hypothetical protein